MTDAYEENLRSNNASIEQTDNGVVSSQEKVGVESWLHKTLKSFSASLTDRNKLN
jgi:vancomycin resistance protein YoaR